MSQKSVKNLISLLVLACRSATLHSGSQRSQREEMVFGFYDSGAKLLWLEVVFFDEIPEGRPTFAGFDSGSCYISFML